MTAHDTAVHHGPDNVAHHFDDAAQQFEASRLGMWIFLATEVLFFGGMFAGYVQYRYYYPEAFLVASHELNVWIGTVNTMVLLTSSLTMALAVRAAQVGGKPLRLLAATLVLGGVFLSVKAYEYSEKFAHHLVPGKHFELPHELRDVVDARGAQLYFSFYFAMTGLHAVHMVIGAGLVLWAMMLVRRQRITTEYFTPVEMVGLYWHFVDIVWVFLFPLLYLIG